jgi:Tfp pilus assembly protein PilF
MNSNNPSQSQKSRKPSETVRRFDSVRFAFPLLVVAMTFAAFLPALSNQFVDWDDPETLLDHTRYQGLRWSELSWMFGAFHMGHYQPLTWVSFAVDFLIWGTDPLGYHLSSVVLHSLNGAIFFVLTRRLLVLACKHSTAASEMIFSGGAAAAALLFSLHPLRVESVAWATERRDVLSGFFYLWTIYFYLRAQADSFDRGRSRRWIFAALGFYLLSLLSKATAMTLPVVLLLLDIYPLGRLRWNIGRWFTPEARGVWIEKIPFMIIAAAFAAIALLAQQRSSALKPVEDYGLGPRLGQAFYAIGFYLWKTLVPLGLSPLYEIPPNYDFWNSGSLAGAAVALVVSLWLFLARERRPAFFAAWFYYVALLAPVSGLAQSGPQLVADRYTYLSCLSWAVLAGGCLVMAMNGALERRRLARAALACAVLAIVAGLGSLSWRQSAVWRNSETLWTRVLEIDPKSSYAHYNLARYVAKQGDYQKAAHHYRQALSIRPDDPDARNNLGLVLALSGQVEESLAEFHRAIEIDPGYAKGYYNLGRVLARRGDLESAAAYLRKALQLKPNEFEIHLALGTVSMRRGQADEARAQFEEAIRLRPDSADAHAALARWLAERGQSDQAAKHYQEALRLIKRREEKPRPMADRSAMNELSNTESAPRPSVP